VGILLKFVYRLQFCIKSDETVGTLHIDLLAFLLAKMGGKFAASRATAWGYLWGIHRDCVLRCHQARRAPDFRSLSCHRLTVRYSSFTGTIRKGVRSNSVKHTGSVAMCAHFQDVFEIDSGMKIEDPTLNGGCVNLCLRSWHYHRIIWRW
jgi:hypothetical protein